MSVVRNTFLTCSGDWFALVWADWVDRNWNQILKGNVLQFSSHVLWLLCLNSLLFLKATLTAAYWSCELAQSNSWRVGVYGTISIALDCWDAMLFRSKARVGNGTRLSSLYKQYDSGDEAKKQRNLEETLWRVKRQEKKYTITTIVLL